MITLCVPTRGRPDHFARMVDSALATAHSAADLQVVYYVADNDPRRDDYPPRSTTWKAGGVDGLIRLDGPHHWNTVVWNRCVRAGAGPIFMQAADDLVFRTLGWDKLIIEAFDRSDDKLIMVHCADGSPNDRPTRIEWRYADGTTRTSYNPFAAHVILHRNWIDVVGYLVPEWFPSTFCDMWVNELADRLDRRVFLPDVLVEHLHPSWRKREPDATDELRERSDRTYEPGRVFVERSWQREQDFVELRKAIEASA